MNGSGVEPQRLYFYTVLMLLVDTEEGHYFAGISLVSFSILEK